MKVTNFYCDICGDKLSSKSYYETMISVSIKTSTNGDAEFEQTENNQTKEYHLCPNCNKLYWKKLRSILSYKKEVLNEFLKIIKKHKDETETKC